MAEDNPKRGYDNKYGVIEIERGSLHRNEPVFLLRGQDKLVPNVIRVYAMLAELAGSPPELVEHARTHANHIELWQRQRKLSKVPD